MDSLAVYIHWPFCRSKCPYCDFNSHVRDGVDHGRWKAALLAEIDAEAARAPGRTVTSIFFGGGTPSLMAPDTAAAVIERIARHWPLSPDVEITLEANPTSVEAGRLAAFRAAGVNRVSLGVQALDDAALRFLGRGHSAAEALAAVDLAAGLFDRFSFDLIYARPGQTPAAWRDELRRALDRAGDHLSLYQLTIERGTAFHTRHARGEIVLPDEGGAGSLYETTQEMLDAAGLPAYEVSNHARPGGASRHNLTYWRYGDYLGIGPGAHGRLTQDGEKIASRRLRLPERWLAAVEAQGHGLEEATVLSRTERLAEAIMMGLRLDEGIPAARIAAEAGRPFAEAIDGGRLDDLRQGGFLASDADVLRATTAGRQRLDAVTAYLLA